MDRKQAFRAVMDSIRSGNLADLQEVVSANPAAATMVTPFGTWLHVAASKGQLEIVRYLVEELQLDINAGGDVADSSPINSAALKGHHNVVRYLLENDASIDTSRPERNPLFGAILGGNVMVAKLLVEYGIDVSIRYTGETMQNMDALDFARERGAAGFVEYLESLHN